MSSGRYHLKRFFAPGSWQLLRKENKFVTRPYPGGHPLHLCVPVSFVLKKIGLANTSRDAKKILNSRVVFVDGRVVTDVKRPVGFMDVVSVKGIKSVRVFLDVLGNLVFVDVPNAETNKKLCRIIGKTVLSKGKVQLNLSDGRNVLSDVECKVGDSLLLELPSQKILDVLRLEKGSFVFLSGGAHIGKFGVVDDIKEGKLWFSFNGESFETLKKFAFVVGKDKPVLELK